MTIKCTDAVEIVQSQLKRTITIIIIYIWGLKSFGVDKGAQMGYRHPEDQK